MSKPASDQDRHKPDCSATEDGKGFRKYRDCTIDVAKTKALISCRYRASDLRFVKCSHMIRKEGLFMTRVILYYQNRTVGSKNKVNA